MATILNTSHRRPIIYRRPSYSTNRKHRTEGNNALRKQRATEHADTGITGAVGEAPRDRGDMPSTHQTSRKTSSAHGGACLRPKYGACRNRTTLDTENGDCGEYAKYAKCAKYTDYALHRAGECRRGAVSV